MKSNDQAKTEMDQISAIALIGGEGMRVRPLSLNSADYLRSKATISLAGRTIAEWAVETLRAQGVSRFFVVAKGRENRLQTKAVLGFGDQQGLQVRYSRTRDDHCNTGSGQATLSGLEHWDLSGLALVFPTDSVFNFDLADMVREHAATGAMVTVASVLRPSAKAAGTYGVFATGPDRVVTRFLEKPDLATASGLASGGMVPTNAGFYLIDCDRLRLAARERELAEMARRKLDWGQDLLPWLVSAGFRVLSYPIAKFGDLGNHHDYLHTVREVLRGDYPLLGRCIDPPPLTATGVRVHESSLYAKSRTSGRTLADRIANGGVRIGPNVRIGRDVEIGYGVTIADSDIGDGVDIGDGCTLRNVVCGDYSIIGPGARLRDTILGSMVDIQSTFRHPAVLDDFCALGDEVRVRPGMRLRGVRAYPRLDIPDGLRIPQGASLSGVRDIVRCM